MPHSVQCVSSSFPIVCHCCNVCALKRVLVMALFCFRCSDYQKGKRTKKNPCALDLHQVRCVLLTPIAFPMNTNSIFPTWHPHVSLHPVDTHYKTFNTCVTTQWELCSELLSTACRCRCLSACSSLRHPLPLHRPRGSCCAHAPYSTRHVCSHGWSENEEQFCARVVARTQRLPFPR